MSLETDVQGLTDATTDLLVAVNVSKATLDGKVANAGSFATASLNSANASAASAATATTQATAAGTARTGAETARDAAVVAQNNAVAVVTGGTATLTPSATKIPLSDAQGKIAKGWLTNTDLVEQTDIGTGPNEIPLNQFLGELAYLDAQNIPTLGINVVNANTANVTNLMQVTEISNAVPSLNLDFAKVKQLDPRITFTRASTGTYYDGKTVAKAEENLFVQSQFVTGWGSSNVSQTANATTAPDGTTTALSIIVNTTAAVSHSVVQTTGATAGNTYTYSVYAKANGYTNVQLFGDSSGNFTATFDLAAATAAYVGSATAATIVAVGNGWYRCSTTFVMSGLSRLNIQGFPAGATASNYGNTFTGDGTSGIFVWGAQLEQRASATAYTPTTTQPVTNYIPVMLTAASGVPRFEHNPVTGESLGLEIEEQRTNLVTYSEQRDAWSANANTSPVSLNNQGVAPNGTLTAWQIPFGASGFNQANYTVPANTATYTWSVYVKGLTPDATVTFTLNGLNGVSTSSAVFTFSTQVFSAALNGTVTPVGNGWYRLTQTFTNNGTGTLFILRVDSGAATNGKVLFWGAQLEAGVFPTSYIPTVASQVTRAADSAVMTGANFARGYNPTEGTVYAQFSIPANRSNMAIWQVYDTLASRWGLNVLTDNTFSYDFSTGGAGSQTGFVAGVSQKVSVAIKSGSTPSEAANGVVSTSVGILAAFPSNTSTLYIGSRAADLKMSGTIARITYYPQRLSNAELVEMTA